MAKRKRLTPSPFANGSPEAFDTGFAQMPVALESRSLLRPPLGAGAPPIAHVAADASAQAALAEISTAMMRARADGLLVLCLPLPQIEADHLVRDRIETDEAEMAHLVASIREHGQRSPIEVTELAPGRYGLISGWRRLMALRRLALDTADPRFATVQALLRRPETAEAAYVAMVEENEIRLGLSYYERARIAARAVDLGVFESERQALQRLFAAASRARRSKIGSFLTLYRALDPVLRFPSAIPERLGLALAQALQAAPDRTVALAADLAAQPSTSTAEEQSRLARFAKGKTASDKAQPTSSTRLELCHGVYLEVSGDFAKPVLTLSGPAVGPEFRERLEHWLTHGG